MFYPLSLEKLIAELAKLPTIGVKSARRMAFSILLQGEKSLALAHAIELALEKIKPCPICFSLTDGACAFCNNPGRNLETLCVVEEASNIFAIESGHFYKGLYHVLEGTLSPIKGLSPEKLRIKELEKRLSSQNWQEIILATNPTMEGEATAHYLKMVIQKYNLPISRLAIGVPSGGDLELIDSLTISKAFSGRSSL